MDKEFTAFVGTVGRGGAGSKWCKIRQEFSEIRALAWRQASGAVGKSALLHW